MRFAESAINRSRDEEMCVSDYVMAYTYTLTSQRDPSSQYNISINRVKYAFSFFSLSYANAKLSLFILITTIGETTNKELENLNKFLNLNSV